MNPFVRVPRPTVRRRIASAISLLALALALGGGHVGTAAEPSWIALTVTNPGAEDGTIGWTGSVMRNDLDPEGKVCEAKAPNTGTYYWCQDGPALQDISIAGFAAEIDAGRFRLRAAGYGAGKTTLSVQWRSGTGTLLGGTPAAVVDTGLWVQVTSAGFAPVGARTARILWDGVAAASSSFDDVEAGYCTTPDAATGVAPAAGARSPAKPTFSWIGEPDATGYQVQVAADAAFAHVVFDRRLVSAATAFTSDQAVAGNSVLYWRIRGTSDCGDGAWSAGTLFYTNPFAIDSFALSDPVTHSAALTNNRRVAVDLADMSRVGATAYYLSADGATPLPSAAGWTSGRPATFMLAAGDGMKTVYAWAKDANGVVSSRSSAQIALDTTGPRVKVTAPVYTRTRRIALAVTATDPHGVTRYAVSQSATPPAATSTLWKPSPPTTFSLLGAAGVKSVYVYARDGAGNVGSKSVRVTLDMTAPKVTITAPMGASTLAVLTTIAGKLSDPAPASGLKKANFAILKVNGCMWWDAQKHVLVPGTCGSKLWFGLAPVASWSRAIGRLDTPGHHRLFVAAEDRAGNQTQVSVDFTITG